MLQQKIHFQLNQPCVVAENFDDEVVAIHLERGAYYSIEKSGVAIWSLAVKGATVDEIVKSITQQYQGNLNSMQTSVQNFLDELQQAELIIIAANGATTHTSASHTQPLSNSLPHQPFEQPILREYTDMQDLLLLDPIHDVDDTGWPKRKVG